LQIADAGLQPELQRPFPQLLPEAVLAGQQHIPERAQLLGRGHDAGTMASLQKRHRHIGSQHHSLGCIVDACPLIPVNGCGAYLLCFAGESGVIKSPYRPIVTERCIPLRLYRREAEQQKKR
jgi:hypothetical protein